MKIAVTGANGQLGNELKALANQFPQIQFTFTDKETLDVCHIEEVNTFFEENDFDFCINTAAYTAVDNAETDQENAHLLNAEAVNYLSIACQENNTKLIHISTDFVFNGKGNKALKETDATEPLSVYGSTKLQGEKYALEKEHFVVRTSWLYSAYGNNFVKTMLRLGKERESLNIIADQIGTPTYAKDLAETILYIIKHFPKEKIKGLYHFSNEGKASWYDFATEIFAQAKIDCKTNAIPTEQYPTPATRPKFSLMDKNKIQIDFGIKLKDWKQSLQQCLQQLNEI